MAHNKVSVTRKYYGKIPQDRNGKPIPKNLWPKRRSFSWEVRWYDSEGKRLSRSFKDRKEAQEYSRQLQDKVNIGKADKPAKITLREFIKEHKRLMKGQVAHATLRDHIRVLRLFAKFLPINIVLEKISPREAEAFISKRLCDGLATATVNKDIRTLKGIFNMAIDPRGYIAEGGNPFGKIKQRKLACKPPRYISPDVFADVIDATKEDIWWKTFLSVAYTTGGRRDEVLNLTWRDVDFKNASVSFSPKKVDKMIIPWEPKDHENRFIPIPEQVVNLLANLQSQTDEGNPYVFIKTERLHHLLRRLKTGICEYDFELVNNLIRSLHVICRRAKVENFTLHDLRRSCITNWARKLPIQVVQQLAGHSNVTTTRKYYLSVQTADLEQARLIQSEVLTKLTNF